MKNLNRYLLAKIWFSTQKSNYIKTFWVLKRAVGVPGVSKN